MRGRRGKRSGETQPDDTGRLGRFCVDCGIRYGRYRWGDIFDFGGVQSDAHDEDVGSGRGVVCRICGSFSRIRNDAQRLRRVHTSCVVNEP